MESVQELNANVKELTEATKRLGSVNNSASVTITGGGIMAMLLAVVGLFGIGLGLHMATMSDLRSETAMRVLAAERRADMEKLESVREIAEYARTQSAIANRAATEYSKTSERRLNELENRK